VTMVIRPPRRRGIPRRASEWWRRHAPNPQEAPLVIGGVLGIGGLLFLFSVLLGLAAVDVWSGIIVALLLMILSYPLFNWVARLEREPWLFRVLYAALIAKFVFSMIRFFVFFNIYSGNGDAGLYHDVGTVFMRRFRDGLPIHPLPRISAFPVETHWVGDITGIIYVFTGSSSYAGFLVFSYLCFWGQILAVRGLRAGVPEADFRRYALLVLFVPTLLFWPSSLGKEALMLFLFGFVAYGGGLMLGPTPKARGIPFFAAGLGGLSMIRPHVALMSVGALLIGSVVALLSRSRATSGSSFRVVAVRSMTLVVVILVAVFSLSRFNERFGGEEGSGTDATSSALEGTLAATSQGSSSFAPVVIDHPVKLPLGVLSVIFRPLPWEATSSNALIGAIEGVVMLAIFATSFPRIRTFFRLLPKRPYLVFSLIFVLAFSVGFSYVGNFGILSRQRAQMVPAVLVMVALMPPAKRVKVRRTQKQIGGVLEREVVDDGSPDTLEPVTVGVGRPREGE